MQNLLGRIERQYILETLSQSLVPFTISYGNEFYSVPQGSYSFSDSLIVLQNSLPEIFLNKTCAIRFYHKDRLLSFLSKPHSYSGSLFALKIPLNISKEEEGCPVSDVYLDFNCNKRLSRFISDIKVPLCNISQNPIVFEEKKISIEKLSNKIGLPSFSTPIAYRLFESLEWFSHNQTGLDKKAEGVLLFIDHESILLLTKKDLCTDQGNNSGHSVTLKYDKRIIKGEGGFKGALKLNCHYCIHYFYFTDIQEEDRRFLFESCYGVRYI